MQNNAVKVGLIGLGSMGRNHLRVLSTLKGFDLAFVCDANADVAAQAGVQHNIPGVTDPTDLLKDVEAVIICTPTVTHSEYIKLAAQHVRNIFVEKPLTATLDEAYLVADFARQKDLHIQVGFIERFNPAVTSLTTVLGRTKQTISLDFTRTSRVSARITDVDVITDLMIHDIDLALYLNGPAKSVAAHGFGASGKMIDFASALITHENGQFSRILASRVTDKKIRKIEGTCVDMFIDCDLLRKEILINRQAETKHHGTLPYTIASLQETVAVAPQEALLSELQAFLGNCRQRGSVDAPGVEAGLAAMEICSKIQLEVTAL